MKKTFKEYYSEESTLKEGEMIFVNGDEYAALAFEELKPERKRQMIEETRKAGGKKRFEPNYINDKDNDYEIYIEIMKFGPVDPKFIRFVIDEIQDYDQSKHVNFFFPQDL